MATDRQVFTILVGAISDAYNTQHFSTPGDRVARVVFNDAPEFARAALDALVARGLITLDPEPQRGL